MALLKIIQALSSKGRVLYFYNVCGQKWASKLILKVRKSQIPIPLSQQICKFIRYVSLKIANPKIFMLNPQIANPQVLQNSQNSYTIFLFKNDFFLFYKFKLEHYSICYIFKEKNCVEVLNPLKSLGSQIANQQITNPPITHKIAFENRKSAKCHIYRISGNLTNYYHKSANLRIYYCETYLRTAHFVCGIVWVDPVTKKLFFSRYNTTGPF
jgi:hypothetical protein